MLRCLVTEQIPYTPLLFAKYPGGVLVGYIGIGILCVEMLSSSCCQCSGLVLGLGYG